MRIGIYDPYLDDLGGGEKYMMTLAQCLSQNHQVEVFWNNKKDLENLISRFSLDLSKINITPNIFSNNISTLKRFLLSKKYDVIIFLSDGSIPLVSSKLFVHIQQPLEQMQRNSFLDKLKFSRVKVIFCNSEYTKSFINKKFNIKATVLYPPVSLSPKNLKKENIILHVGRFRVKDVRTIKNGESEGVGDYKKQTVMINAFKQMIDKGLKDWGFVLTVSVQDKDLSEFEDMKKISKGYPIYFLVNKRNNDLWEIYSKAKIYWHASGFGEDLEKHPEFAEHFGISTVEAMGAGVVPVVINAGGQKEIVQDGENGYLWDSIEQLQSKTLDLINNQGMLIKMQEKAKLSAKKFSKDIFCKNINELINK